MSEYHSIKWIDENTATRKTKEVDLKCTIYPPGNPSLRDLQRIDWRIMLVGTADLEHHLVEDSSILLKKMAEVKCGEGH